MDDFSIHINSIEINKNCKEVIITAKGDIDWESIQEFTDQIELLYKIKSSQSQPVKNQFDLLKILLTLTSDSED